VLFAWQKAANFFLEEKNAAVILRRCAKCADLFSAEAEQMRLPGVSSGPPAMFQIGGGHLGGPYPRTMPPSV